MRIVYRYDRSLLLSAEELRQAHGLPVDFKSSKEYDPLAIHDKHEIVVQWWDVDEGIQLKTRSSSGTSAFYHRMGHCRWRIRMANSDWWFWVAILKPRRKHGRFYCWKLTKSRQGIRRFKDISFIIHRLDPDWTNPGSMGPRRSSSLSVFVWCAGYDGDRSPFSARMIIRLVIWPKNLNLMIAKLSLILSCQRMWRNFNWFVSMSCWWASTMRVSKRNWKKVMANGLSMLGKSKANQNGLDQLGIP